MGVVKNGNDRSGVEENAFGLIEQSVARGRVARSRGGEERGIVGGVCPTRVVGAAGGGKDREKRSGVGVIGGPDGAKDLEIAGAASRERALEFLVGEADFQAQFAAPHFLYGFGDGAVDFGGIEQQVERRKSAASGRTRFGAQPGGGGGRRCGQRVEGRCE